MSDVTYGFLFIGTFISSITSLALILEDGSKYVEYGFIGLIVTEAVWLFIILPIVYYMKYRESKDINKRYLETKENIYKIINDILLEFCYISKRERRLDKSERLIEAISMSVIKFQFPEEDIKFLCAFDEKVILLKENHIDYYIKTIDTFLTYWQKYRIDRDADTWGLIDLRKKLKNTADELYKIESEMRCYGVCTDIW